MAGTRHHILPRFLQKGFASKIVGREVFTWVYRKEKVFEANIINVSVERHFYGKEGELNVDNEITEIEYDFAKLLDQLRSKDNAYKILNTEIADFVGHLSMRTKHLRDSLIESSDLLTTTFFNYLSDRDNLTDCFLNYYKRHPEVIRQAIDDALKKMQLPKAQRLMMRQRMLAVIRPKHIVSKVDNEIAQYNFMFATLGTLFSEKLPSILRTEHIKLMAKTLIPEPRVEEYRKLNWFVCKSKQPLIIGDIGCLFEVEDKKRFVSISGKDDNLQNIYLPISSDTLIVGTYSSEMPEVDFNFVNENFVKCSRDFFICSENSKEIENLLNELGKDAEVLGIEGVQLLLKEVIEEM